MSWCVSPTLTLLSWRRKHSARRDHNLIYGWASCGQLVTGGIRLEFSEYDMRMCSLLSAPVKFVVQCNEEADRMTRLGYFQSNKKAFNPNTDNKIPQM